MFDEYAKKLKDLGENVPVIFKNVARRGVNHFVKEAVELTDREKAVDTGAYKRNWAGEVIEIGSGQYGIACMNSMEYASFLEDGYNIARAHFVPFDKMQGSPKTQQLISSFRAKYPNAKGFIAKPRRFKGLKIGKRAMIDTEGWAVIELQEELDAALMSKKYNITKSQAKKYLR